MLEADGAGAVRAALRATRRIALAGRGRARCFRQLQPREAAPGHRQPSRRRMVATGRRYKGLTTFLETSAFSATGRAPMSSERVRWGPRGRARGVRVDRQLTTIANGGDVARPHKLTLHVLAALCELGLRPVAAQVPVCSARHGGVATACDLLCISGGASGPQRAHAVEIKCGFLGVREQPFTEHGAPCRMRGHFRKAVDSHTHRHLAQLACTAEMLSVDPGLARAMHLVGIDVATSGMSGLLLYASTDGIDVVELPGWWQRRAQRLLC